MRTQPDCGRRHGPSTVTVWQRSRRGLRSEISKLIDRKQIHTSQRAQEASGLAIGKRSVHSHVKSFGRFAISG